nr:hypothetical protein [Mucilaginibacter sp. X4EP1]
MAAKTRPYAPIATAGSISNAPTADITKPIIIPFLYPILLRISVLVKCDAKYNINDPIK